MHLRLLSAALLLCSLCVAQKKSSTQHSPDRLAGLDAQLQQVLDDWNAAGFAVAVVEKDRVIYSKGFGVKDINTKQPVTANTLFAIGSCTKAFTSTLVGQLVQTGKANYDEPVRKYLPQLEFYNHEMNNLITLRDMMSHKTGLPRHDLSWYFNQTDNRDSLLQRIRYQEPTYRPKEKYQYNNFMFFAQGVLVEKLSGKTWEQNMREKILQPLGMSRSDMPYSAVKHDNDLASPHAYKNDSTLKKVPHYNIGGMAPAGAMYSSATEMANWLRTWIHGGKFNGKEIVPAVHYREATSAQIPTGNSRPDSLHPDISSSGYGFGWTNLNYRGHYRVEHGGAIDGFIATTAFFPTDSIGIVVLTNQDNRSVPAIVRNIISDRLLGLKPYNWNQEELDRRKKTNADAAKAKASATVNRHSVRHSHDLKSYEGMYEHPGYGSYEVSLRNDSLIMRTSLQEIWLDNWHYDVFRPFEIIPGEKIDTADQGSILFRFNTGVDGSVESMNAFGYEAPAINLSFKRSARSVAVPTTTLQQYTGDYDLNGTIIKFLMKDDKLYADVPGQTQYELVPQGSDKFALKVVNGYYVQFEKDASGKILAATFQQPNGNFKAVKK